MQNDRPFGIKDKIGYMCGDFGNDFFFILASSFLTVFYTNVLGIKGTVVGTLFLTARCVDAFTDIGMGRIVDNAVPGDEGRYRPWIRRMKIPVILAGVLVFLPWAANLTLPARIVYVFVTYILWGSFCYTGINIPYGSMASVITNDPVERSALSTFRSIGAALAGVFVGFITPLVVYRTDAAGNKILVGERLFLVACVFAILAYISYTICYRWSVERIQTEPKREKMSAGQLISGLLHNRALVAIIAAAIVLLLSMLLAQTMNVYLYQDYFRNTAAMSVANLLGTACTLILAPFAGPITRKFGKKEASSAALLLAAAVYGFLYMVRLQNPWIFCGVILLGNMGSGLFNLMIWAFISDIIDYQTYTTGSEDGGTVYGVYSFARKIGQALAGGIGGFVISAIGYQVSSGQEVVVQTKEVTDAIYGIATGIPALGYLVIALILMFWYPLSKKKLAQMREVLDQKGEMKK